MVATLAVSMASAIGAQATPTVPNTSEIELRVDHPGPTHDAPIGTVLDLSADGRSLFFRYSATISTDDGDWLAPTVRSVSPESGALTRNGAELVIGAVVYDRLTGTRTALAETGTAEDTGASRDGSVVAYVELDRTVGRRIHVVDRTADSGPIELARDHMPFRVAVSDGGAAVAWLSVPRSAGISDGWYVNVWRRGDGQVWRSEERFVTDDLDVDDDGTAYVIGRDGTIGQRGLHNVSSSGVRLVASDLTTVDACAVTVTVDPPSLLGRYGPTVTQDGVLWFRSNGTSCELVQTEADGDTAVLDGDVSVIAPILRSDDGSVIAYHRGAPLSGRQVVVGHTRLDPTATVVDIDTRPRPSGGYEYDVTFSDGAIVNQDGLMLNGARVPPLGPGEHVVATERTGGAGYTSSSRAVDERSRTRGRAITVTSTASRSTARSSMRSRRRRGTGTG